MENLNIIVIGAGMAGLTAGIALKQAGYRVRIYERVEELRPAGAAISLWSNGVKVLNRLGLAEPLAAIGGRMASMGYYDAFSGEKLTHFSLQPLIDEVGQPPYPVTRTELQNLLLEAFGKDDVRFGAKLTAIQDDGEKVTAIFENGETATADLLIGADGTHSIIREHVLGVPTERRYAGYVNWNGLVPASEKLTPTGAWVTYVAEGKRVSLMPVADGRLYFFFDVPLEKGLPTDRSKTREELRAHFTGWAAPVQLLIDSLDPQTTTRVEIHDVPPFSQFARGRVALVGDSAHSTTPDLGQGGCQAMESAFVLANCLKSNNLGIEDALHRFEKLRVERAAHIVNLARKRSDVTHGIDLEKTHEWYEELKHEDGIAIRAAIAKTILAGPLN